MIRSQLLTAIMVITAFLWGCVDRVIVESDASQQKVETRVYDISDLIEASGEKRPTYAGGMLTHPVTRRLMDQITSQVGEEEAWSINGGQTSSVDTLNDVLVVRTTASNHDEIAQMITDKRKALLPGVAFHKMYDLTYPGEVRLYPIKDQIQPRQWIVHPFHVSDHEDDEGPFGWRDACDELKVMISLRVGGFNEWIRNGGESSRIDHGPEGLLISTSPDNHTQVERLLKERVPSLNTTVRFEARCLIVPETKLNDSGIELDLVPVSGDSDRPIGFAYMDSGAAEALYEKVQGVAGAATMTLPALDVRYREKTYLDWGIRSAFLSGYKEVPTVGPDGEVVDEFGGTFIPLTGYYEEGLIFAANVGRIVEGSRVHATIRPTLLNVAEPIAEAKWWLGGEYKTSDTVLAPEVSALYVEMTLSIPDGAWFVIDMGKTKGPIAKTDRPDKVAESLERKVLLLVHVKTVDDETR